VSLDLIPLVSVVEKQNSFSSLENFCNQQHCSQVEVEDESETKNLINSFPFFFLSFT
jgi:hypothetical protein